MFLKFGTNVIQGIIKKEFLISKNYFWHKNCDYSSQIGVGSFRTAKIMKAPERVSLSYITYYKKLNTLRTNCLLKNSLRNKLEYFWYFFKFNLLRFIWVIKYEDFFLTEEEISIKLVKELYELYFLLQRADTTVKH